MGIDIDEILNEFFKKCVSVGHHNVKYCWMQITSSNASTAVSQHARHAGTIVPNARAVGNIVEIRHALIASTSVGEDSCSSSR